jgi:hypothetical protein
MSPHSWEDNNQPTIWSRLRHRPIDTHSTPIIHNNGVSLIFDWYVPVVINSSVQNLRKRTCQKKIRSV